MDVFVIVLIVNEIKEHILFIFIFKNIFFIQKTIENFFITFFF